MHTRLHHAALAAAITLVAACADGPTQPELAADAARNAKGSKGGGGAGTTLVASKSAIGYHEVQAEYDWSIRKDVKSIMDEHMHPEPSTTTTRLDPRTIKWLDYVVVVTRSEPTTTTVAGVRGEICVENAGDRPTEGLAIRDVVQRKAGGSWSDVASKAVGVSAKPVLAAGEQHCYPYDVALPPTPGEYRNTAFVTITNHSGHLGEPFGPAYKGGGVKAGFSIPASPTRVTLDERAHLWDPAAGNVPDSYQRGGCAALWPLFFCTTALDGSNWHFTGDSTIEYVIDIGNLYACGDTHELTNTVVLTESGRGDFAPGSDRRVASATIDVTTPDCPPATSPVRTAAYWSAGTGWPPHQFWGNPQFAIQTFPFFDTGATWLGMLRIAPRTVYDELAREYIAATLNLASGAPVPASVREARSEVGRYLASWPEERALVSDAQLRQWRDTLAAYNAGGA